MSEDKKEPLLLDHNYDGIQEYDNPLPNWWLITFFGTIIFGFIYFVHYVGSGVGPTLMDEFKASMEKVEHQIAKSGGESQSEEVLAALFMKPENLALGREVFQAKCASCHAPEGGGLIGPNLSDRFWINGKGTRKDIYTVVAEGVVQKGMPSWESLLKKEELIAVSSLVYG